MEINRQFVLDSSSTIEPVRLKFGIDQLLADQPKSKFYSNACLDSDTPTDSTRLNMTAPCSHCVTSLYRCCNVNSPTGCSQGNVSNFLEHHFGYGIKTSNIYTVQPIRPFATRPKYNDLENSRFSDPRSKQSFKYDHLRKEASDYLPYVPDSTAEPWRAALDNEFLQYTKNHYKNGVCSVVARHQSGNITLKACIEDHPFQPKSMAFSVVNFI
ncbi:hypothetical protein WA026_012426 [Henosepilachna vigintioctopunctata]|uniref:F-actin-capping protein subunit alpha n=1 Tax=Henosepilachna vigintioctopunctata TaxID=420089 RepID=A0AAW1UYT6_9CUCU